MIIGSIRLDTNAKKRASRMDTLFDSIFCCNCANNGDYLILCNRDNNVPRLGNTDFPQFVREIELFSKPIVSA